MFGKLQGWVWGLVPVVLFGCAKARSEQSAPPPSAIAPSTSGRVPDAVALKPRPARAKLTCAALVPKMEEMAKSLKMPIKTTPGSWGKVPKEIQVLPPDGKLCGALDLLDQALVTSSLAGKDLEAFYAPLFAKIGCEPFTCEDVTSSNLVQTRCQCKGDGLYGSVTTDTASESITIGVIEGGLFKKKKPKP